MASLAMLLSRSLNNLYCLLSKPQPVTPKSSAFLGISCIAFIAAVGSVFELTSGQAELGTIPTAIILGLSIPLGISLFMAAIRDAKASQD
jgi:hypothetical protein